MDKVIKVILVLWCIFVVGDYVKVNGSDPNPTGIIQEVYVSEKGNCIYKVLFPRVEYYGECNSVYVEENVIDYWIEDRLYKVDKERW